MKRLLTEIMEYVCKPAVNGQIVLRYFHRQFYKYFKQYRQKELYQLALNYLDGTLHKQFPARQISVEEEENSQGSSSLCLNCRNFHTLVEKIPEMLAMKMFDIF